MTSDIKNKCISCPVCAQYASQAPKEPMLSHDIPERPLSLISQDITMWEGKWHLVTTCHYTDWVEIDTLPNTLTSTEVELVSEYGFEHVTSSPYWSQGNGKAEVAVETIKRMYQKNKDIHMALRDYRNTPQQGQEQLPGLVYIREFVFLLFLARAVHRVDSAIHWSHWINRYSAEKCYKH